MTLSPQFFCQKLVISPKKLVISHDSYQMRWGRAVRVSGKEALGTENAYTPHLMSAWKDREQILMIVSQSYLRPQHSLYHEWNGFVWCLIFAGWCSVVRWSVLQGWYTLRPGALLSFRGPREHEHKAVEAGKEAPGGNPPCLSCWRPCSLLNVFSIPRHTHLSSATLTSRKNPKTRQPLLPL